MSFFSFYACLFCQASHFILAACLIGSIVASKPVYRQRAIMAFHTLLGGLLLLAPSAIFGRTILGVFDANHAFQQRFLAPFHIGFAVFHFLCQKQSSNPYTELSIIYGKNLASFTSIFVQLATAYSIYNSQARGLQTTKNFFGCVILIDGIWQITEKFNFARYVRGIIASNKKRTLAVASDDIDMMVKRTHRWVENSAFCLYTQIAFWTSAGWAILIAIAYFAYPEAILQHYIRREFVIDTMHLMYVRMFAGQQLALGLITFAASSGMVLAHQQNLAIQLIVTHALYVLLNAYGHFVLGLYNAAHILLFVLSFFLLAIQAVLFKCVGNERSLELKTKGLLSAGEVVESDEGEESVRTTTYALRKTVRAG